MIFTRAYECNLMFIKEHLLSSSPKVALLGQWPAILPYVAQLVPSNTDPWSHLVLSLVYIGRWNIWLSTSVLSKFALSLNEKDTPAAW